MECRKEKKEMIFSFFWKEKCEMTANSKQSYDEDNVRMNCSPT